MTTHNRSIISEMIQCVGEGSSPPQRSNETQIRANMQKLCYCKIFIIYRDTQLLKYHTQNHSEVSKHVFLI